MNLVLTLASNGDVLDTVTVTESGKASYDTGEAKPIIAQLKREAGDGWLSAARDWSNGYLVLREGAVTAAAALRFDRRSRSMAAVDIIRSLSDAYIPDGDAFRYDPNQPRDHKGRWTDGADVVPSTPSLPKVSAKAPGKKGSSPARGDGKGKAAPASSANSHEWISQAGKGKLSPQSEKAIRGMFAYTDPDTGMSTKVSSVEVGKTGVEMTVDVLDPEGRLVGKAVRSLGKPKDGQKPQIYHASLFLGQRAQGGGFSTRWLRQMEDNYRAAGIGSIALTTNDVGSYAWAKAGFDFADGDEVKKMGEHFKNALSKAKLPPNVATQGAELVRRSKSKNSADWPTPLEFAMLGWTPGATDWVGKSQIMGTAWKGVKQL